MSIPKLSEATIRRYASASSLERGESYYRAGAVVAVTQRGQTLRAEVEGSEVESYDIRLTFDKGGLISVACSCPYTASGWCKHIVATLLVCQHQPEAIEARPTLDAMIEPLHPQQLRALIQELVAEQPNLVETIDRHMAQMTDEAEPQVSAPTPRHTSVDPAPIRREVRQILRNAVQGWESGWDDDTLSEDIQVLINKAQDFTARGDSSNAMVILEAITASCVADWDDVGDYGADSDEVVAALDQAWAEAILSTDLSTAENNQLQAQLSTWQKQLSGTFEISQAALHQGWGYPPLQRVFEGEITELGAWDDEAPDYADDLALIRLRILERQERFQDYLNLAQAEGQTELYLTMLGRLGEVDTAMTAAQTQMMTSEEAYALAQVLREQGAVDQALDIARTGLELAGAPYQRCRLADWTSELAEGLGEPTLALAARITAFKANPSFGDYQKAEELSGDAWSSVRADLINSLSNQRSWDAADAKVDIFLHEGLIDNAITAVKDFYYRSHLVQRVMDAAMAQRPEWVIEQACSQAEAIMNAGKANAYHHAIEWLEKARDAYLASDQQATWTAYRSQLMQTHRRKHKLMGMLARRDLE